MRGVLQRVGLVGGRTRWLAISAAFVAAITGAVSLSLLFPVVPIILIFGAIVQPRFHRTGFWLMWVGALFLSVWVLPIGVTILLGFFKTPSYHDFNAVGVTLGWAASFLLLAWCDAALMIESRKLRLL